MSEYQYYEFLAERPPTMDPDVRVLRRDRLGGLIGEYAQVA